MFNPISANAIALHIDDAWAEKVRARHRGDRSNRTGTEFEDNYAVARLIQIMASEYREGGDGKQSYLRAGQATLVDDLHVFHQGVHTYSQLKSGDYRADWVEDDIIPSFSMQRLTADALDTDPNAPLTVLLELIVRDDVVREKVKSKIGSRLDAEIHAHDIFEVDGYIPDSLREDLKTLCVFPEDDHELGTLLELIASSWRMKRQVGYLADFINAVMIRSHGALQSFDARFVLTEEVEQVFSRVGLAHQVVGPSLRIFREHGGPLLHEITSGTPHWKSFVERLGPTDNFDDVLGALLEIE